MYTNKFAKQPGEFKWSVEILPPELGTTVKKLRGILDPLVEYKPIGIDVTYHQEEMASRPAVATDSGAIIHTDDQTKSRGLQVSYPIRKKPGTIAVCAALAGIYAEKYDVEIIPHLICGGFSVRDCEEALIDCFTAELNTVLALRGDPPQGKKKFVPHPEGHRYASQLVEQITHLNAGKYFYPIKDPVPAHFCIGVAGYPDKHCEAPNMTYDLLHLKEKVDKGAHYIVTQMVFDTQKYISFVEAAHALGISVPIVPGLKPITKKTHLFDLSRDFHIEFPLDLTKEIVTHSDEATSQIGLEWTIQQCKDLLRYGVPSLHFYSMNKGDQVMYLLKQLV